MDKTASIKKLLTISLESLNSVYLAQAINLWKQNSITLGLFPEGAFQDSAHKNWIIYLLDNESVAGYLLYRVAKGRAVIVHLCVDLKLRRMGYAKQLFDALCTKVDDGTCRGVEVRCRRDYDASKLWPKLDFEHVKVIPGRGKKQTELAFWFYRFDTSDFFFDMLPQQNEDELVWAVLDANVVFKLKTPNSRDSQESLSLLSDTISSYTRYFVTPEIFTEIERRQNSAKNRETISFARKFEKTEVRRTSINSKKVQLESAWSTLSSERDRSDFMHLVYTAAAGIGTFITLDEGILDKSKLIYTLCGVKVVRPVEFIVNLDEVDNSEKYVPKSVDRTQFSIQSPRANQIIDLAQRFSSPQTGEKQKQLEAKLRAAIASPNTRKVITISDAANSPRLVTSIIEFENALKIELLRHDGSIPARTIVQDVIWKEIASTKLGQIQLIELHDKYLERKEKSIWCQRGFFPTENGWIRIAANITGSYKEVTERILMYLSESKIIHDRTKENIKSSLVSAENYPHKLEEAFWPLKILSSKLNTKLIPIKPYWAMHLFDSELANLELLGADPIIHFNWENVYYRSSNPLGASEGTRILWYVSSDRCAKVSAIRACSRLISVDMDTAKILFKKYQRLGIYAWKNLMDSTGNDPNKQMMAFRFYQTEQFINPIKLCNFSNFDLKGAPPGPWPISNDQFAAIYNYGMKPNEK